MTKYKKDHRQSKIGGGWSQSFTFKSEMLYVVLKRGRFTGKRYGNRCFEWSGLVFRNGKQIYAKTGYRKSTSVKQILADAGIDA